MCCRKLSARAVPCKRCLMRVSSRMTPTRGHLSVRSNLSWPTVALKRATDACLISRRPAVPKLSRG